MSTTTVTTTDGNRATTTTTTPVTTVAPDDLNINVTENQTVSITKDPHNDPELARKCYPCGNKTEVIAKCWCEAVQIRVKCETPQSSLFCHCVGCKRAHAAPVYQVLYTTPAETVVIKGEEHLKKTVERITETQQGEGNWKVTRDFCDQCGTRMLNCMQVLPTNDFGMPAGMMYGTFPPTYDTPLSECAESWQPTVHFNTESAHIDITSMRDGLSKLVSWGLDDPPSTDDTPK